ncbi:glycosyltransferase [bacterium]|nr:glycosyltransferase [bacterium]
MKKSISIIVPVYNAEKTLKRCLDSLIKQTYKNLEIVCVDDCSVDNSFEILNEYASKDSRVKVFKNDVNKGVGYTRQKGLDVSTSEYIMWCDSDDWYELDMCKKMINAMLKYDVDMVECSYRYVDVGECNERFLREKLVPLLYSNSKRDIDLSIYNSQVKMLWNKIFKRSIIDEWNLKIPSIGLFEDIVFCFLYLMKSKNIYFLDKKLYNYVRHPKSTVTCEVNSHSFLLFKEFMVFKLVFDFVKENGWNDKLYICNELYFSYLKQICSNCYSFVSNVEYNITNSISRVLSQNSKYFPMKMNIFFATDNNYVEQLYVAIRSILTNAYLEDMFNFYILDGGISRKNKKLLSKLQSEKANIEYLKVDNSLFESFPENIDYITKATYFRFLIPQLKPSLKKCLYLDCDIVVNGSLRELYNIDLEDNYIVAVQDGSNISYNYGKEAFGVDAYFNAGVLLINNEKWVKDDAMGQLINNVSKLQNKLLYNDQDVLNYTFKGKVKFIDWKFNMQTCFFTEMVKPYKISIEDISNAKKNPLIVHYSNSDKPWKTWCSNSYWYLYYSFLKITPFRKNAKKYLKNISKKL